MLPWLSNCKNTAEVNVHIINGFSNTGTTSYKDGCLPITPFKLLYLVLWKTETGKKSVCVTLSSWNLNNSSKWGAYLLRLIEHTLEISKRGGWELPKDLPEELLWVNSGTSFPVALPRAPSPGIKASGAVGVILLPLHFITQDLQRKAWQSVLLRLPGPRAWTPSSEGGGGLSTLDVLILTIVLRLRK